MQPLIAELQWRGMIQDIMPGTKEQLDKEMTTAYIGFDPTADSLHIGSLVPILLLVHLQKAGHKPIALVGGATGMVGDPSGKSEERNLLSEQVLRHNQEGVRKQLEKFLQFDCGENSAEIVNNYDWFKKFTFLDFIRDVGKYITVNYMMAKDSVKKRLDGDAGMSFTEFTYQLVQGYDFYWLYKNKNCKLQMGGSDQWGNIVTGTELIRKKTNGEAFAFTCPLITKADGGKFGKTEKGNIWLDPAKTSPFHFYQFWLNASDEDAKKWIKIFTLNLEKDYIEEVIENHNINPEARNLQFELACNVTNYVHGDFNCDVAIRISELIFGDISEETLKNEQIEFFEMLSNGITTHSIDRSLLGNIDLASYLALTKILASKGDAKKIIQAGGISINKKRVEDPYTIIDESFLLVNKYFIIQKGKKNYFLITCN